MSLPIQPLFRAQAATAAADVAFGTPIALMPWSWWLLLGFLLTFAAATTVFLATATFPGGTGAWHHAGHSAPRKLQAERTLLSEAPLQTPRKRRAVNRQAQALQTRRYALREDRHQLLGHYELCVRATLVKSVHTT